MTHFMELKENDRIKFAYFITSFIIIILLLLVIILLVISHLLYWLINPTLSLSIKEIVSIECMEKESNEWQKNKNKTG